MLYRDQISTQRSGTDRLPGIRPEGTAAISAPVTIIISHKLLRSLYPIHTLRDDERMPKGRGKKSISRASSFNYDQGRISARARAPHFTCYTGDANQGWEIVVISISGFFYSMHHRYFCKLFWKCTENVYLIRFRLFSRKSRLLIPTIFDNNVNYKSKKVTISSVWNLFSLVSPTSVAKKRPTHYNHCTKGPPTTLVPSRTLNLALITTDTKRSATIQATVPVNRTVAIEKRHSARLRAYE